MSKMRICFLAAVAAAGIGLGGTFGASAVPMNGNLERFPPDVNLFVHRGIP